MSRIVNRCNSIARERGNAMAETLVALLALTPFIAGIALLGKQLDIKQKSYDAIRYSVWERTIWSGTGAHGKTDADLTLETRARALGHPLSGLVAVSLLWTEGVTQNPLWRDVRNLPLLEFDGHGSPLEVSQRELSAPTEVGRWLVPAVAYGVGPLGGVQKALQLDHLDLAQRAFASSALTIRVRPLLAQLADSPVSFAHSPSSQRTHEPLRQSAHGAILSDTWSARDENSFGKRVDRLIADELISGIERPGRPLGLQALSKGGPLYGEGQFGWDPDFRPRSFTLPSRYLEQD